MAWLCSECRERLLAEPCPGRSEVHVAGLRLQVFSGWAYNETLQQVVHHLKYRRHFSLGLWLGRKLAERTIEQGFLQGDEILVPVPLHWRRMDERGFNQSEKLIDGMLQTYPTGRKLNGLRRSKYTRAQATLSKDERLKNVTGAFRLKRRALRNHKERTIVLVDDVLTTGATLVACQRCFVEAGVQKVLGLTLTRA